MSIPICQCKEPHADGVYNLDELVTMPVADKWWICHIPCGCKADQDLPSAW